MLFHICVSPQEVVEVIVDTVGYLLLRYQAVGKCSSSEGEAAFALCAGTVFRY
jgi:hypothetical protein